MKRKEGSKVGFWDPNAMERGEADGAERMETDGNGSECNLVGREEAGPSSSASTQIAERERNAGTGASSLRESAETEKGKGTTTTSKTTTTNNKGKQELELQEITVAEMYPDIAPYEKDETQPMGAESEKVNAVGVGVGVEAGEFGEVKLPKTDRMVRKEIVRVGVVAVIVLVVVLVFVFK